jgi:parallel beta-helix repeat protein
MRRRLLLVAAAIAFGAAAPAPHPAAATTFHVASTPGASDANPGTLAQPWATLQHAVDATELDPGDTILVHAGTYAGARIERSGTEALPITLRAAPGEVVLLNAPSPEAAHNSVLEVEDFDGTIGHWVIEGFEVDGAETFRYGIDLRDTVGVVVRGNRVERAFRTGIFTAFSDDVLIEGNESFDNCEHGIYHSNSGDRPVIRANRLHGNVGAGIHMNADLSQGGDGVISDALVEGNLAWDNGGGGCGFAGGGAGINMDGVVDSLVRNNLIWDEHASGIAVFRIDGAVCSQGNRILNNTVLTAADGRWAYIQGDFDGTPPTGCPDNELANNIFWSAHGFRGAISLDEPSPAGFASRHNLVEGVFSVDDGDTTIGLAAWQALGYEAGSQVIANATALAALFENQAGADFHLAPGSAAVDLGEPRADVPQDLDGSPRPQGTTHDAGAYEAGELIFADGFESGGTGAWSLAVP